MWVSQAGAHTGSHAETSFSTMVQHFASSPYHMGLLVVIAASLAIVIPSISHLMLKKGKKK